MLLKGSAGPRMRARPSEYGTTPFLQTSYPNRCRSETNNVHRMVCASRHPPPLADFGVCRIFHLGVYLNFLLSFSQRHTAAAAGPRDIPHRRAPIAYFLTLHGVCGHRMHGSLKSGHSVHKECTARRGGGVSPPGVLDIINTNRNIEVWTRTDKFNNIAI